MARKVFISILGTGPYGECTYSANERPVFTTRYIQLATLKYLVEKCTVENNPWTVNDVAIIFLTSKAESDQWNKGMARVAGQVKPVEKEGLKAESEKMDFPFVLTPKPIKDGKDTDEIWDIFDTIFNEINDGDELYFDITHAFRYLPMLLTVLINYSKFLKKVTVKSITYGNFMAETDSKPIMDLTSISVLQDWTYAAGTYLDSGNVTKLVELKSIIKSDVLKKIVDKLETVIKERQTCRGLQIHNSESLSSLKSELSDFLESKDVNPEDEPLHQILKKVDTSLEEFSVFPNFMNGFQAAKWCVKNGLFQQAITMLRENFVTLFCERHGFDLMDKDMRLIVEIALNIQINHKQNRKDKWPIELSDTQIVDIESVLQDKWIMSVGKHNNELVHIYQDVRDYRNNFNHAGFNENSPSPQEIEAKVNEFVERTITCFYKLNNNQ